MVQNAKKMTIEAVFVCVFLVLPYGKLSWHGWSRKMYISDIIMIWNKLWNINNIPKHPSFLRKSVAPGGAIIT